MIKYQCPACGQEWNFGGSAGGRKEKCHCGTFFFVPFDPAHEAMRRLAWCVQPMGTSRHGLVCGQLRHYGENPLRTDVYFDKRTDKRYEKCVWQDITVWMDSAQVQALEQSSKGKRKAFAVTPPIVEPPDEQCLVHVGGMGTCV